MIDDDFESVFRRMIEQFMEAFGGMPEGSMRIRSWNDSMVNEPLETDIEPKSDEPLIEKIDLGDRAIILVELQNDPETPTIRVSESTVTIQFGPETKEINVDVGFHVDQKKSNVSHRNGVLEISVVKAEVEDTSDDDGYLKIE